MKPKDFINRVTRYWNNTHPNDIITITGFKEGKQKFTIKAEGYLDNEVEVTFDADDSVVETTVVMHKET